MSGKNPQPVERSISLSLLVVRIGFPLVILLLYSSFLIRPASLQANSSTVPIESLAGALPPAVLDTPTPIPGTGAGELAPPQLVEPANGTERACFPEESIDVRLRWNVPAFALNIGGYEIELLKFGGASSDTGANTSVLRVGSEQPEAVLNDECGQYGFYRWRVRAVDNLEQAGAWSEERVFSLSVYMAGGEGEMALREPGDRALLDCVGSRSRKVDLQWEATGDPFERYEVELVSLSGAAGTPTYQPVAAGQSHITVELVCGRRFQWRIRALDPAGNVGSWSTARTFSLRAASSAGPLPPLLLEPNNQTSLVCLAHAPLRLQLNWQRQTRAELSRWQVEVAKIPRADSLDPNRNLIPPPTTSLFSLPSNQTSLQFADTCGEAERFKFLYRWRVRAIDSSGNPGVWSAENSFRVTPVEKTEAPLPFDSTGSIKLACAVGIQVDPTLRWTVPVRGRYNHSETYEVEVSELAPNSSTVIASHIYTSANPQQETKVYARCGSTFSWRVRRVFAPNEKGPWSFPAQFTLSPNVVVPPYVKLLEPGDGKQILCPTDSYLDLRLYWTPVLTLNPHSPGGARYQIELRETNHQTGVTDVGIYERKSSADFTSSKKCGTTFRWRVRSVSADDVVSAWSPQFTVHFLALSQAQDPVAPASPRWIKPGSLTVSSAPRLNCTPARFDWETVSDRSGINGYRIYLYSFESQSRWWQRFNKVFYRKDILKPPIQEQLPSGKWYLWRVGAIDNAGNQSYSPWSYFYCQ